MRDAKRSIYSAKESIIALNQVPEFHLPVSGRQLPNGIYLHAEEDFAPMRRAGRLAAQLLDYITSFVVPGVTTNRLDQLCHDFTRDHQAIPAPLNYRGFPKSICTSINEVICHGIPSERRLISGDILNIDVTVILDGWYGDSSRMFMVGDVGIKARHLIDSTYKAMMRGISVIAPGRHLGDIGQSIQSFAEAKHFSVVRDFCGHGIGRVFHDAPTVLHFGKKGEGPMLQPGMFFTVEPMINEGKFAMRLLPDGWTAETRDRKLSAQFEHTVAVTPTGYEVFTLSEQLFPDTASTPTRVDVTASPLLAPSPQRES